MGMGDLCLLCVHAHPDDEALFTGGVLARYAGEGVRASVVTCTGGERGRLVGPGTQRLDELRDSLGILGCEPPRLLGYLDSGTRGAPGNDDPASFWRAPFDQAVGRMVAHIRELRPDVVVTYDAYGVYGHPDHIQAHRVARAAVEAAEVAALYPEAGPAWRPRKLYETAIHKSAIAGLNLMLAARGIPSPFGDIIDPERLPFGTPDHRVGAVVDVRPWLDRKRAAIRVHVGGLGPDSLLMELAEQGLAERALGQEWFARVRADVETPAREDDLLTGLRESPVQGCHSGG